MISLFIIIVIAVWSAFFYILRKEPPAQKIIKKTPFLIDFDGDGKTDMAIYRADTGSWLIHPSSGGQSISKGWGGEPTDKPVPGDYDGDGKIDFAIYRASTGNWLILLSSNGQTLAKAWGESKDQPVPGDYDGDGKTDIAVYRPGNGGWYILPSSEGQPISKGWGGEPSDIPLKALALFE